MHAHCDSQLVTNQYSGDCEATDTRMEAYLNLVRKLSSKFEQFELTRVPRAENSAADALAALASTSEVTVARIIPIETISHSSILLVEISFVTTRAMRKRLDAQLGENSPPQLVEDGEILDKVHPIENEENQNLPDNHNAPVLDQPPNDWGADWREPIRDYILKGILPAEKWAARKLKATCARFCIANDILYRRVISASDAFCIFGEQTRTVMKEVHDDTCGNHTGGRSLAFKVKKYGYYWPTLIADCEAYACKCEQCQKHAPLILHPQNSSPRFQLPIRS